MTPNRLTVDCANEGGAARGKERGEEKYAVVNIDHRPARAGTLGQVPEVIVVVARHEPNG